MLTQSGIVQKGISAGRKYGYPTANIPLIIFCEPGTYAGWVKMPVRKEVYPAAVYVDLERKILEAHLLNFSGDLYGQAIEVDLITKLQDVRKFEETQDLQIFIDEAVASVKAYFETRVEDKK